MKTFKEIRTLITEASENKIWKDIEQLLYKLETSGNRSYPVELDDDIFDDMKHAINKKGTKLAKSLVSALEAHAAEQTDRKNPTHRNVSRVIGLLVREIKKLK
jgi:hypothetical protein